MLKDCNLGANVIVDMKKSMPSADKLAIISNYLEVSVEYLLGITDDPMPPKKSEDMTDEERFAAEVFKMSPKKQKQAEEYVRFLKTQEEFSQELGEFGENIVNPLEKQQSKLQED